jgi:hypothetical protein
VSEVSVNTLHKVLLMVAERDEKSFKALFNLKLSSASMRMPCVLPVRNSFGGNGAGDIFKALAA